MSNTSGLYSKLYEPTKPAQPKKEESTQVHKPTSVQVDKPASTQVDKTTKPQTNKTTSAHVVKTTKLQVVKYTTHLKPDTIKGVKRQALEEDRKDYEIVQEALEDYLKKLRR
jgi:hypothetical protein